MRAGEDEDEDGSDEADPDPEDEGSEEVDVGADEVDELEEDGSPNDDPSWNAEYARTLLSVREEEAATRRSRLNIAARSGSLWMTLEGGRSEIFGRGDGVCLHSAYVSGHASTSSQQHQSFAPFRHLQLDHLFDFL